MAATAPQTIPALAGDCITYFGMVDSGAISAHMGAAVHFGTRVDEARMRRALQLLIATEPVLGYRFVPDPPGPVWERAEIPEGAELLPVVGTVDPDADASAFVASAFDPCAGPQVRGVLLRSQDRDTLALQVSHVAMDGRGVADLLYRLAAIHHEMARDPGWVPAFNADAERAMTSPADGVGLADRLRSLKAYTADFVDNGWPYLTDSGERGSETYRFGVVEPREFRAAKQRGRAAGGTINDVLFTSYHRSLCAVLDVTPGASTPINMTVDLREYLSPAVKWGLAGCAAFWQATIGFVDGETFDETLARTVSTTRAWKESGLPRLKAISSANAEKMMRGPKARRLAGVKMGDIFRKSVVAAGPAQASPMFTNIGVIDEEKLDFGDGVRADRCRWFPPIAFTSGCLGASAFRERLEICMAAKPEKADAALVRALVDGTVEELTGWAGA